MEIMNHGESNLSGTSMFKLNNHRQDHRKRRRTVILQGVDLTYLQTVQQSILGGC